MKETTYATRGQVFYYNPLWGVFGKDKAPKNVPYNGSLELKTRPHLVISTDKGNFTSPTCNLLPITTRDSVSIPSQVYYTNDNRHQVILTEQVITANIKDLGEYVCTLSDEVMTAVRKGLYIQFDITPRTADIALDNLAERLDNIVSKVIESSKQKVATVPVEHIDDLALKLVTSVEELLPVKPEPAIEVKAVEPKPDIKSVTKEPERDKYAGLSPVEKFNKKYGLNSGTKPVELPPEQPEKPVEVKKGRKPAWDLETQKQFLRDCAVLSPDEMMTKYHLASKKTVYSHKYLIRNRLEAAGESL